jgi:hypothetical protein
MPNDLTTTIGMLIMTVIALVASVTAIARLRRREGKPRREAILTTIVAVLGVALLAWRRTVAQTSWHPLNSHIDGVELLMTLLAVVMSYLLWIGRLRGVELFALPLLTLLGLWGVCASWWTFRPFDIRGVWDGVHVTAAYLAIAAAALAAVTGAEYLFVQRLLRKRKDPSQRIRLLGHMASLESIESWMLTAATTAFVLVSIVLVVGTIDATSGTTQLGQSWYRQPKVLIGAAGWLLLAAVCHVRFAPRFRGARAAILAVIGFIVILCVLAMAVSLAK